MGKVKLEKQLIRAIPEIQPISAIEFYLGSISNLLSMLDLT
jgi:hypothetical protein